MSDELTPAKVRAIALPPLHLRPRSKEEQAYFGVVEDKYVVPDVIGLEKPAAVAHIAGAGFAIGKITTMYHDEVKKGFVVTTKPPKGIELPKDAPIDVVLSYGPRDQPEETPARPVGVGGPNPRVFVIPDPQMPIQYELPKPESK